MHPAISSARFRVLTARDTYTPVDLDHVVQNAIDCDFCDCLIAEFAIPELVTATVIAFVRQLHNIRRHSPKRMETSASCHARLERDRDRESEKVSHDVHHRWHQQTSENIWFSMSKNVKRRENKLILANCSN